MSMINLKVKRVDPRAILPQYQTAGAACFDLHAIIPEDFESYCAFEGSPVVIDTGLSFEVPAGWVMKVYSRSGHGFKHDVRLANGTGVIDSDYRGTVQVKLTADAGGELRVKHGDRIAQAMLVSIPRVAIIEVDELSTTERGTGGFGSTDKEQP